LLPRSSGEAEHHGVNLQSGNDGFASSFCCGSDGAPASGTARITVLADAVPEAGAPEHVFTWRDLAGTRQLKGERPRLAGRRRRLGDDSPLRAVRAPLSERKVEDSIDWRDAKHRTPEAGALPSDCTVSAQRLGACLRAKRPPQRRPGRTPPQSLANGARVTDPRSELAGALHPLSRYCTVR